MQPLIWHPFTQMKHSSPLKIDKAQGVYLHHKNRSIIDGISSWWVNLHGHCHPKIAQAISDQTKIVEHVIFAEFTHEPALKLAQQLLQFFPYLSKVFYSDNGSTAVETAIKMALQYWFNKGFPKKKIICFQHSYHGDTFGAMSAAGKNLFNRPFWSHLFEVIQITAPLEGDEEKSLSEMRACLEDQEVAAFIYEPLIMAAGGMIIYKAHALESLLKLCIDKEILLIADEVMTGFGRTPTFFASEAIKIKPDIICLSKGITGGFLPLGATLCKEHIYSAFLDDSSNKALLHGHSYTANPIACVSALASIELLLETHCTQQRFMIEKAHQAFCLKWQGSKELKRLESFGTLLVLEYKNQDRDSLYHHFLSDDILLRPIGKVLYVLPPYVITKNELQTIYQTIEKTLC